MAFAYVFRVSIILHVFLVPPRGLDLPVVSGLLGDYRLLPVVCPRSTRTALNAYTFGSVAL
uniref:hypothetical protein n=1 Tax=Acinetobacter baumannii TaxID=470 RepID=UPI00117888C6